VVVGDTLVCGPRDVRSRFPAISRPVFRNLRKAREPYNITLVEECSQAWLPKINFLSLQLCNIPQPDDTARRCIRYENHPGPHQTFVSEWNEGDKEARRRPRPATAAPKHHPKWNGRSKPFRRS
jgi:hypothetical protein